MKIAILYSHSAHKGIIDAMRNKNIDVIPFHYGLNTSTLLNKTINKVFGRKSLLRRRFNTNLIAILRNQFRDKIDGVLVLKGHSLSPIAKKYLLKNTIPIIQWTTDSVLRESGQLSLMPYVDKILVQDGADTSLHKNSEWLPLGFDDALFSFKSKKSIDILLIGNLKLPFYENRSKFFYEIAKLGEKKYSIFFAGSNANKSLTRQFAKFNIINVGYLSYIKYAELIRESKIIVNIHQNDGTKPLNPMFFIIPAVGGIQITENRDYFSCWATEGLNFFPTTIENVNEKIIELLESNFRLDESINRTISEEHSFNARLDFIIKQLDSIK